MPNVLYYGDNLEILRERIPDESVDLIYLDPPFNSNASYNVLFGSDGNSKGTNPGFRRHMALGPRFSKVLCRCNAHGWSRCRPT